MALTEAEIQEIYTMMDVLGVARTDDLKADVVEAMKKFSGLYNGTLKSSESALRLTAPSAYTKDFGVALVDRADRLQETLETAKSAIGVPLVDSREKLEAAFKSTTFPAGISTTEQKTDYMIAQLQKAPRMVELLNRQLDAGWPEIKIAKTPAAEAGAGQKEETATNVNLITAYENQIHFEQYKFKLFPQETLTKEAYEEKAKANQIPEGTPVFALEDGTGVIVGMPPPPGQQTSNEFYTAHYQNINAQIIAAQNMFKALPGGILAKNSMPQEFRDGLTMPPKGSDSRVIDEWHIKAQSYMEAFLDEKVQNHLNKPEKVTSMFNTIEIPLTPEQIQSLQTVSAGINEALNISKALAAKHVGPEARVIAPEVAEKLNGILIMRPGKPYLVSGKENEDIETYKEAIGDTAPRGSFGEKFKTLSARHNERLVNDMSQHLAKLKPHLSKVWAKIGPEYVAEEYMESCLLLAPEISEELAKVDLKDAAAYEFDEQVKAFEETLQAMELSLGIARSAIPPDKVEPLIEEANKAEAEYQKQVEKAALDAGGGSSGEVVENKVLTSLENASLEVETALLQMAPFMLENGITAENFVVSKTPDGTFDEVSQKALQVFLMAAHQGDIADMGEKPWEYTPEKGVKLAEGLKKKQDLKAKMIAQAANKLAIDSGQATGDVLGVNEKGELVFLADDAEGKYKKGDKYPEASKKALEAQADKKIDDLILYLNLLNENGKLAKENITGVDSALELTELGGLAKPLLWVAGLLQSFWPQAIPFVSQVISTFTGKEIDLEKMLAKVPPGMMNGPLSFLDGALGKFGSKSQDGMQRLIDNYKMALTAKDEEGNSIGIKQIREKLARDVLPFLNGTEEQKQAYREAVDRAIDKAQEIGGDTELAATVFAAELSSWEAEQAAARVAANPALQENPVSGVTASSNTPLYNIEADRWSLHRAQEERALFAARSAPIIQPQSDGRIFMIYYDSALAEEKQQVVDAYNNYNTNVIKPLDRDIGAYKSLIKTYEKRLETPDDYYESELTRFRVTIKGYQAQLAIAETKRLEALQSKEYNGYKARYTALNSRTLYPRVDISDDVMRMRQDHRNGSFYEGVLSEKYPNIAKLYNQHQNNFYAQWNDPARIHEIIEANIRQNYTGPVNRTERRDIKSDWREATGFEKRWDNMEKRSRSGMDVAVERKELLVEYEKELKDNPYLRREEIRSGFRENAAGMGAGVMYDFNVVDPANQFTRRDPH